MKKLCRSILAFTLLVSMVGATMSTAFASSAEEGEVYQVSPDVSVYVQNNEENPLSEDEIDMLLDGEDLKDGDIVTIYDVVDAPETEENLNPGISLCSNPSYVTTTTKSGSEYKGSSYFLISVAKGATVTLAKKFSQTVNLTVTAGTPYLKGALGSSVTATYSTTYKFTGPSESSSYNSREFRVRFYMQKICWTQKPSGGQEDETHSGTANVPTRYAMYSIDSKQS